MELPDACELAAVGPTGLYALSYIPDADKGYFRVAGLGRPRRWEVLHVERDADGWTLGGGTDDTEDFFGDNYWYQVRLGPDPWVEYWGDQVLIRRDPIEP